MLFYLFGAAATIVATVFISKTAREKGRSGLLWGLVSLAVGFGTQIILPVIGAIVIALIYLALGTPRVFQADKIEAPTEMLFYVLWFLSFVFLFLVLRFVANAPEISADPGEVPPPPTFN